jgi:hypothetical protein
MNENVVCVMVNPKKTPTVLKTTDNKMMNGPETELKLGNNDLGKLRTPQSSWRLS